MTNDLYNKLVCALTHAAEVCNVCKKCGNDSVDIRMGLIRQIAKEEGKELPWRETNDVR